MALSSKKVEHARLKEGQKTLKLYDGGNGLMLVVRSRGKYWVLRLAVAGKPREVGLGSAAAVGLVEARDRVFVIRRLLREGVPLAEAVQRATNRSSRLPGSAAPVSPGGMTFKQAAEAYMRRSAPSWKSEVHTKQWDQSLSKHVYPLLGDKPVLAITTEDKVTPGSTQPAESKGDKNEDKKEVTLADVLSAVGDMAKRLDAIEGKRGDNEDGKPLPLAADDSDNADGFKARSDAEKRNNARSDDYRNDNHFADFQARVDSIAAVWPARASAHQWRASGFVQAALDQAVAVALAHLQGRGLAGASGRRRGGVQCCRR